MASSSAVFHEPAEILGGGTPASSSVFSESADILGGGTPASSAIFSELAEGLFMSQVRAKNVEAGTFGNTATGRAPFGVDWLDLATANSIIQAGAIAGSKLANSTVTETQLAASVSGNGLTGGAGSALAVGAGTGIVVNANDVALATTTGTPTYSAAHVSTHTVDTLQVTGTPDTDNDPVNLAYLNLVTQGLSKRKDAARLATAAVLPFTPVYGNGTAGVGATLTAGSVGILTVDGVATVLNDRILVKDQAAGLQDGIYEVTTEGTAGVAYILTRTTDADNSPGSELESATVFITAGTANSSNTYTQIADPVTVGTTALNWIQTNAAASATTPRQEQIATEVITGTDTALSATLSFTPVSAASVILSFNGIVQDQGAGLDYTISGTTITWLASTGTAVNMDTGDGISVAYQS